MSGSHGVGEGASGQFQKVLEPLGTVELTSCTSGLPQEEVCKWDSEKLQTELRFLHFKPFCFGHLVDVQKNRVTHVGMELARPSHVSL